MAENNESAGDLNTSLMDEDSNMNGSDSQSDTTGAADADSSSPSAENFFNEDSSDLEGMGILDVLRYLLEGRSQNLSSIIRGDSRSPAQVSHLLYAQLYVHSTRFFQIKPADIAVQVLNGLNFLLSLLIAAGSPSPYATKRVFRLFETNIKPQHFLYM